MKKRQTKQVKGSKKKPLTDKPKRVSRAIKCSSLTRQQVEDEWKLMMCRIKVPEYKQDLEETWAEFNQMLDRKENCINRLKENRCKAVDQFKTSAQGHYGFICYAKKLYHLLAKSMRDMYEHEVEQMLDEFRRECIFHERTSNRFKNYYENIMHGTNVIAFDAFDQMEKRFLFEKEDSANHNIECREKFRESICNNMNKLFQQMESVVAIIRENSMTDERIKLYKFHEQREQFDSKQIEKSRNDAQRCMEEIDLANRKLFEIENGNLLKISDYNHEKKYFSECFSIMRERYNVDMKCDNVALRFLVNESNRTISMLKEHVKKGEQILAILGICRKLQTEREKIVAIDCEYSVNDCEIKGDFDEEFNHLPQMELFWKKVGIVKGQNLALMEEKCVLEKENEQLKNMIRQYCNQQSYARAIDTLKIPRKPTVAKIPVQEAAHNNQLMRQLKK